MPKTKTTNDNKISPLTDGEIKFARRVEGTSRMWFKDVDHEQIFQTLRAIKQMGYSIVELKPVEELFEMGVRGDDI